MESMTSERIADFLDKFALTIRRDTFIVPDNAKVHRSKLMKEMGVTSKPLFYCFEFYTRRL